MLQKLVATDDFPVMQMVRTNRVIRRLARLTFVRWPYRLLPWSSCRGGKRRTASAPSWRSILNSARSPS